MFVTGYVGILIQLSLIFAPKSTSPASSEDRNNHCLGLHITADQVESVDCELREKVSSEELGKNLEQVKDLLRREKLVRPYSKLAFYLRSLISLEQLESDTRCDLAAYQIKYENDDATGGRTHGPRDQVVSNGRIYTLVHETLMRHARKCLDTYPGNYESLFRNLLDHDLVYRAAIISDNIVRIQQMLDYNDAESRRDFETDATSTRFPEEPSAEALYKHSMTLITLETEEFISPIYNSIKVLAAEDSDLKRLESEVRNPSGNQEMSRTLISKLCKRYIFMPCEYYSHHLGMLFEMFDFDLNYMTELEIQTLLQAYPRLFAARGRGKICDLLIGSIDYLNEGLKRLLPLSVDVIKFYR